MKEEVTKKRGPIYKKWWFWVILVVVIFGPIFSAMDDEDEATNEENKEMQQEEQKEVSKEQEDKEGEEKKEDEPKKLDKKIELDDEILFVNFNVYMDEARIYEENGKVYMDLSFDWLNTSFEDSTTFMRAAGIDVHQGDQLLEEITDAYNDKKSDVYFPNAVGGKTGVDLTYELVDSESELKIVFVPWDQYDDSKELIININ